MTIRGRGIIYTLSFGAVYLILAFTFIYHFSKYYHVFPQTSTIGESANEWLQVIIILPGLFMPALLIILYEKMKGHITKKSEHPE